MSDSDDYELTRRERGARVITEMFGEAFLEKAFNAAAESDSAPAALGRLALEQCFGDIWGRPGLTLRDRSLVTLGILLGAGNFEELATHVRGALSNGLTPEELQEVALHAVPYAGFPTGGRALQVVSSVLAEPRG